MDGDEGDNDSPRVRSNGRGRKAEPLRRRQGIPITGFPRSDQCQTFFREVNTMKRINEIAGSLRECRADPDQPGDR